MENKKISRFYTIVLLFLYRIFCEHVYSTIIATEFAYEGFTQHGSALRMIESWLAYIIIIIAIPKTINKPSDLFVLITGLVYIIPLTVYYALTESSAIHFYIVIVGFFLISIFRHGNVIKIRRIHINKMMLDIILWCFVGIVLIGMFSAGAISHFNLDINAVYDYREEVSDLIDKGAWAYLNNWVYNTIIPCLLVISIWRKSILRVIILIISAVILYGISSHKAILFYPFAVIFTFYLSSRVHATNRIIIAFTALMLIPYLSYHLLNDIILSDLLVRRLFFVPVYLTFKYYEYFSSASFFYWAQSLGNLFNNYELSDAPAKIIGYYIGGTGSANSSFFATGYMHAGLLGVIIYSIIVSFVFRLIDSFMKSGIPFNAITSITIVPVMILITSSDLTTSLVTHGLIMVIFILYLLDCSKIFNGTKS